jgi:hypothetical protein
VLLLAFTNQQPYTLHRPALNVAVPQRGLQRGERRHGLAVALQLGLTLFVSRLDSRLDLAHGDGVRLGMRTEVENFGVPPLMDFACQTFA